MRWGSRRGNLASTLFRIVEKLRTHERFSEFDVEDVYRCRIMFEMVTDERPIDIGEMHTARFDDKRFEPGITGIKVSHSGKTHYFMPTDAITYSCMSARQVMNRLSKKVGIAKLTPKVSERIALMLKEPMAYDLVKSVAFVSFEARTLPLFRGCPIETSECDAEAIQKGMLKSIDWLIGNMRDDGRFLYYYDGIADTEVDFQHPNMTAPLYYNILRHSGGTIALLRAYEISPEPRYLEAAERSLDFLISTFREHRYKNQMACYPFFNQKSKLGGAGIGLVALMMHYIHTSKETYREQIDGLVRHILSRVDSDGEMLGYYIHPKFNAGKALVHPSDEVKKELFSFYYPGEALLGLALYYKHMQNIDRALREDIVEKSRKALDFLVDVRPVKYAELFAPLPSDAWLMQAIEEWADVEGFDKPSYLEFVYGDAETMIAHMYTEENSPYPDYVGGFYYYYGEHVYQDASRAEGLMAAYYLAHKRGETERAGFLMQHLFKAAQGIMRTRHTPESTYAHRFPKRSIDAFRFKLTRQWVRVDSVQHTACFYARLLKAM